MITSGAFSYINVLDKAADASWLREATITNNLANVDTPGFKRKDVDFEGVLKTELGRTDGKTIQTLVGKDANRQYVTLDQKVKDLHMNHLNATAYTDSSNFSYRLDGNNVDVDTEQVELASEQLRYTALTDSITHEISRFKSVLG